MSDEDPILIEFDYLPSRWQMFALFALVTAGAVLIAYLAWEGRLGGVVIKPENRFILGLFACLSPIGILAMGGWVYVAFACKRRIAITRTALLVPIPTRWQYLGEYRRIALNAITNVRDYSYKGAVQTARIECEEGVVSIQSLMFRRKRDFDLFVEMLKQAVAVKKNDEELES